MPGVNSGIVYTRWMDKREDKIMSTKHPAELSTQEKPHKMGNPF